MKNKLLVIGFVWPEPKSSAAGYRVLQILHLFLDDGYEVTFASACTKTTNAFNLETIGVKTASIALNSSSFDVFISELNPNVVMFDRFMIEEQFGWRVSEQCPNALKILDTEDFHGLRKGRQQAVKAQRQFTEDDLFSDVTKREIASILRCDLTLMISEFEMDLLTNKFHVQETQLFYLPFITEVSSEFTISNLPIFKDRNHIVTVGNFMHEPNWQSVLILKKDIWPKLKKALPDAELHIYGSYVSPKASQLHNPKERFYIKGFAENIDEVLQQAKVCTAFLPFGAGLKGKLFDAMKNGAPCAMNSIAAEAMFGDLQPNGFVTDSIEDFVTEATQLYTDETFWKQSQANGFKILEKRFNTEDFNFLDVVNDILKDLKKHRQKHFLGQVLQHQTLQSSKYMSKWIEAKNK